MNCEKKKYMKGGAVDHKKSRRGKNGIKVRGCGCATKGSRARGPMG